MLVLSMNSKRQRRPNVRLGEIGDVPAAFACGYYQKTEENFGNKRYKNDFLSPGEDEDNLSCELPKQIHAEFVVSHPDVSQRVVSAEILQQNTENKNPNSLKSAFEFTSLAGTDIAKSELNFGTITRKCRLMKRRGRSTKSNNDVFGCVWSSKLSHQMSSEDGKECGVKEFAENVSEACNDYSPVSRCKDIFDHEYPGTRKEACQYDIDEPICDVDREGNSTDHLEQEDDSYEGNCAFPTSDHIWDEMKFGSDHVLTVARWLEDQGFGKYAGVFEMHEVDEEALPLLTLEDLKEMGVFAVGPRRKLYNAIQRLRSEDLSACQQPRNKNL